MFDGKSILVTGGTGSFGKQFCEYIVKNFNPERLIIYSRDEFKQAEMMSDSVFAKKSFMRFFLGDVRDKERLTRAMTHVNYVVHAAALKQVPAAEYNPHEFIKTNIIGSTNLIEAALNSGVEKVIALSTDKAVTPINLYGATKLCSEKVFIASNSYSGKQKTRFSVVRYGNVFGSRGSVIPLFIKQKKSGVLSITDERMTRFFLTIQKSVLFVIQSLENMKGGEVFIPKIPSCKIVDIANAIAPDCKFKIIGIRPGEKLHETLIPNDEAYLTVEFDDHFVIQPTLSYWDKSIYSTNRVDLDSDFCYSSNKNNDWIKQSVLIDLCNQFQKNLISDRM